MEDHPNGMTRMKIGLGSLPRLVNGIGMYLKIESCHQLCQIGDEILVVGVNLTNQSTHIPSVSMKYSSLGQFGVEIFLSRNETSGNTHVRIVQEMLRH